MRLLKMAFWFGLVILLIPSDEAQQAKLYQNASVAIERATTFCDRNARSCEVASAAWGVFVKKLEIAARMGYDLATSASREEAAYQPATYPAAPAPYRPAARDGEPAPWRTRSDNWQPRAAGSLGVRISIRSAASRSSSDSKNPVSAIDLRRSAAMPARSNSA